MAGLLAQQRSNVLAKVLVPECPLDEKEQQEDMQETLYARVGEAERRCALFCDHHWLLHVLERGFTDEAIVADALDVRADVGWLQSRSCAVRQGS